MPTSSDWKRLILENQAIAGEIADAAILLGCVNPLVDDDVEAPLDMAAFNASASKSIALLHSSESPLTKNIEKRVADFRGPAVRTLAREVGLGAAPELLISVLGGMVTIPKKLLPLLAGKFEVSSAALKTFLLESWERQTVPSYKATQGKPETIAEPMDWADAVRAAQLPAQTTKDLIDLDS